MLPILKSKNIHIRTLGAWWRRKSVTTCTRDCRSNPTQDFFFFLHFLLVHLHLNCIFHPRFLFPYFLDRFWQQTCAVRLSERSRFKCNVKFYFFTCLGYTFSQRGLKGHLHFCYFLSFHFSWPVSDTSLLLSEPLKLIASVYKGLFGDFQVPFLFLGNYPVSGSCSNR